MLGASCTKAESVNMLQTQHTCRVTEFGKQEKGTEFDLKFELANVQIWFHFLSMKFTNWRMSSLQAFTISIALYEYYVAFIGN